MVGGTFSLIAYVRIASRIIVFSSLSNFCVIAVMFLHTNEALKIDDGRNHLKVEWGAHKDLNVTYFFQASSTTEFILRQYPCLNHVFHMGI